MDSGFLLGESYSGSFSYDDTGLAGSGSESVGLVSFAFNFLSSAFTLGYAEVTPSVDFLDGLLLGLSYSVSSNDPFFALIAASGLGLPGDTAYFSYSTVSGESGFGSLAFDYTGTVDEPLALVMLGIGLVGIRALRRR